MNNRMKIIKVEETLKNTRNSMFEIKQTKIENFLKPSLFKIKFTMFVNGKFEQSNGINWKQKIY